MEPLAQHDWKATDERDARRLGGDLMKRQIMEAETELLARRRSTLLGPEGLPFEQFEFVGINFQNPDEDMRVRHDLRVDDPHRVYYIPVMKSHDCTIYDKRIDPDPVPWTKDAIVVRSNVGPAYVVLLLVVMRDRSPLLEPTGRLRDSAL